MVAGRPHPAGSHGRTVRPPSIPRKGNLMADYFDDNTGQYLGSDEPTLLGTLSDRYAPAPVAPAPVVQAEVLRTLDGDHDLLWVLPLSLQAGDVLLLGGALVRTVS